jgi:hypothetical protein
MEAREEVIDLIKKGSSYAEVLQFLKRYLEVMESKKMNQEFLREFKELKSRLKKIL